MFFWPSEAKTRPFKVFCLQNTSKILNMVSNWGRADEDEEEEKQEKEEEEEAAAAAAAAEEEEEVVVVVEEERLFRSRADVWTWQRENGERVQK